MTAVMVAGLPSLAVRHGRQLDGDDDRRYLERPPEWHGRGFLENSLAIAAARWNGLSAGVVLDSTCSVRHSADSDHHRGN